MSEIIVHYTYELPEENTFVLVASLIGNGHPGDLIQVPTVGKRDRFIPIHGISSRNEDDDFEFHIRADDTFREVLRGLELQGETFQLKETE